MTLWVAKPPAPCPCRLNWPFELLGLKFNQQDWDFTLQSKMHSYSLIYIFANQAEWLHSNQSGHYFLNQSNPEDLESLLQNNKPIRDRCGAQRASSLYKAASILSLPGSHSIPIKELELQHQLGLQHWSWAITLEQLKPRPPCPGCLARGHLTAMLSHCWAVSWLSCFNWVKSVPSPPAKLGTPVGIAVAMPNLCWQQ